MGFEIITSMVGKGLGEMGKADGEGKGKEEKDHGVGNLGRKRDEL